MLRVSPHGRSFMGMDPKQERALRSGRAKPEDRPRDTAREAVRRQEAEPPVEPRPRPRRTTAAVADIRVNIEGDTPVDRLARRMGAEPIPEAGTQRRKSDTRTEHGRERGNGASGGEAGGAAPGRGRRPPGR